MKRIIFTAIAAPALLYINPAIAENVVKLDEVNVTAQKQSLSGTSEEKSREELAKIAGGVAVVSKKEFENTRAVTVNDMLSFVPGVFAQTRYGEESRLSIRGSGLSRTYHLRGIKLLQDGIPMNLADGGADFQEIDPSAYSHLEVYKGANALRYGANSLGGAVNFVTPTGYTADKLKLTAFGGSFDTRKFTASSGEVVGNADYFISASNLYSEGFRDFAQQNNSRVFTNVGYKFNENLETRFYLTYADINQELAGSLTKAQLKSNPRQAAASSLSGNQQRDYTLYRVANKTSYKGESFDLNGGVYTIQKDLYHPIFQIVDQQNADYGAFVDSTIYGHVTGLKNEFTVGSNVSTGRVDAKQYINNAGNYGALTNQNIQKADNVDLYAEERLHVRDDLSLIAGGQGTYGKRDYGDYFLSNGNSSDVKSYRGFSPKIGVLYEYTPKISYFANLSAAYEVPTFAELTQSLPGVSGLADIEAQRSKTLEVGTRGEIDVNGKPRFSYDASWYYSIIRDELMSYATGPTTTAVLNADDTIHSGVELGISAVLVHGVTSDVDSLNLRLAYTHNNFRFDKDKTWGNNQIPGAPENYVKAEVKYDSGHGYYITPNVEYIPEGYPVDFANTLYSDPYAIVGVNAGYDITKTVTLFADARNLLDKKYAATTGVITTPTASNSAQFVPGDGRALYVGVTYKFN